MYLAYAVSAALALAFLALTWGPAYDQVARWGGTVWVLLLSLIITLPLLSGSRRQHRH